MAKKLLISGVFLAVVALAVPVSAQDDVNWKFRRGDVDASNSINLNDVFEFLNYVFMGAGQQVECDKAYDFDGDGTLGVPDVITMLEYQFLGGEVLPGGTNHCGTDETELTCVEYPGCPSDGVIEIPPEELAEMADAAHILRRITYGQTPTAFDEVIEDGPQAYIDTQLDPDSITENADLIDMLDSIESNMSITNYYRQYILKAIYSEKQLVEVLTDFWDNHFNTEIYKLQNYFDGLETGGGTDIYTNSEAGALAAELEFDENEGFRANALGMFEDLLMVSAQRVPMTIYLDSVYNQDPDNPNENYAREIMELHTLGVDNLYTQEDITELARLFTGWGICLVDSGDAGDPLASCEPLVTDPAGDGLVWNFHFYEANHDFGEVTLFPGTAHELTVDEDLDGGELDGLNRGLDVVTYLAELPQTAEYVCTKLVRKFVADEADPSVVDDLGALIADCLATWDDTGGDISEVMDVILSSDTFQGSQYRLNKVRTPMEFAAAVVRAFEGDLSSQATDVIDFLEELGHLPANWPTPDGFPEDGHDHLSTTKVLERLRFSSILFEETTSLEYPNITDILSDREVETDSVDAVAQFWVSRMFGDDLHEIDVELAFDFLGTNDLGGEQELQPWANLYRNRMGKFLTFLCVYPQFMQQ